MLPSAPAPRDVPVWHRNPDRRWTNEVLELLRGLREIAGGFEAAPGWRDGDARSPIHYWPADRSERRYRNHASLPPAHRRHQSGLGTQGTLRHQPELDVDRRHGSRRERTAAGAD